MTIVAINRSAAAQDAQQTIGPFIDLMNKVIEDARIRNSPEFQNQEIQPGGLTKGQVIIVQQLLIQRGYDIGGADGVIGPKTMAIVGQLQAGAGLPITGYPDQQLLQALVHGQ